MDGYLDVIQAPESLRARVGELLEAYGRVVDLSRAELFVSDAIDAEGNRSFPSMWVFTPHAAYEGELSNGDGDQLDGTALAGRVVRWVVRTRDFAFTDAGETARMHVEIWFSDQLVGELKATGVNCDRLTHLLRDRIEGNLGRVAQTEEH